MSPEHQLLHVSCLCVLCASVWPWFALQFALQDLKIALASSGNKCTLTVCTVLCGITITRACVSSNHAVPQEGA